MMGFGFLRPDVPLPALKLKCSKLSVYYPTWAMAIARIIFTFSSG